MTDREYFERGAIRTCRDWLREHDKHVWGEFLCPGVIREGDYFRRRILEVEWGEHGVIMAPPTTKGVTVEPTKEEIDEVLNECAETVNRGGSKVPGMSYEEGVQAGILWVTGQSDEHPMAE